MGTDNTVLEQSYLLAHKQLVLSPDVRIGRGLETGIVLKQVPLRSYLTVTQEQYRILQRFKSGATAAQVLIDLIRDRSVPPLRVYYELVLKAIDARILTHVDQLLIEPIKPNGWKAKFSATWSLRLALVMIIAGIGFFVSGAVGLPTKIEEIALGFGLVSLCLSLGYLWAGSVLRGAECEVYSVRIKWIALFPHFYVDTDDACMGGRRLESIVAQVRMAPLVLVAGLSACFAPEFTYVLLLGFFFVSQPFSQSPLLSLLRALFLRQRLATGRDFLFVQNRLFWSLFRLKLSNADLRYWLIYGFYTFLWLLTIGWLHLKLFNLNFKTLLAQIISNDAFRWFNLGLLSVIGLILLISLFLILWIVSKNVLHFILATNLAKRIHQSIRHPETLQLSEVVSLLEKNLLFQNTDKETRIEFARRALSLNIKGGRYIIREGEEGDSLYVIYSGSVEVLSELVTGRVDRVAKLGPGEAFGEVALINHTTRTRSVRAINRTTLLALRGKDFDEILVSRYGGTKILEIIQRRAFLSRIQMSSGWHPQAIEQLTSISEFVTFSGSIVILQKGQPNSYFFIIYEGRFEVRNERKKMAILGVGDFFGELSLMQNSSTIADISVLGEGKCLRIHKNDFIKFICHDFLIGMQFEEVGNDRLHHPLYPVDKRSFEIMEPG